MDYPVLEKIVAAAERGPEDLTKLLEGGVDINTVEKCSPHDGTSFREISNSALTLATRLGKVKVIEILLDHGASVDTEIEIEKAALHIACEEGREDIVKLLLDIGGADIDADYFEGITALHVATEKGHEVIVKLLLDRAADVDAETHCGTTALHLASEEGQASIVKLLVEGGATVNTKDMDDRNALFYALGGGYALRNRNVVQFPKYLVSIAKTFCNPREINHLFGRAIQQNNIAMAELLLKQETGLSEVDFRSHLREACKNGNKEIVKILLQNDIHSYLKDSEEIESFLQSAIEGDNFDIVKMLSRLQLNINAKTNNHSAEAATGEAINRADSSEELHCETRERAYKPEECRDYDKVIELLLEHGADINDECHRGSLLHCLCELGYVSAVKKLLSLGADVSTTNSDGETLLYSAVKSKIEDMVTLVLDLKWFDINDRNTSGESEGESALHLAAQLGNEQVVLLLLNHGANINDRTVDRNTALYYAIENGHNAIAQLLSQRGATLYDICIDQYYMNRENALHVAAKFGNETLIELFLNLEIDINSMTYSNKTALDYALCNGDVGTFKALLDNGADIEGREDYLVEACTRKYQGIAQLLLERGADSNARDLDEEHVLLASIERDNHEVIQLLLDYGTDIEAKDHDGFNALHAAVYEEHFDGIVIGQNECLIIVEQLLDQGIDVNGKRFNEFNIGTSALKLALARCNVQNVQLLLNYYADVNIGNNGESVLTTSFSMNGSDIRLIIVRHVVKMMSENLFVSDKNLQAINNQKRLSDWKTDCEREIEALKCKTIENTAISFYDLLVSKSLNQLGTYARNKNVIEFFKAGKHRIMFPMYEYSLGYQLKRGVWRNYLEGKLKHFFCAVANAKGNERLPILLDVCVTKVFSNLANRDLRRLIRVSNVKLEYGIHDIPL